MFPPVLVKFDPDNLADEIWQADTFYQVLQNVQS